MPVHPQPPAIRQPALTLVNTSSLQNRSADHNPRKKIPRNFIQTKLRSPLESTKLPEKQAKTKLTEAENAEKTPHRRKVGRPDLSHFVSEDYAPSKLRISAGCVSVFAVLSPIAARQADRRPSSLPSCAAVAAFSLDKWAYRSRENAGKHRRTRKKHPPPKAGMSHGINNMSQKGGLDRKLESPLESTKRGLHRMQGGG